MNERAASPAPPMPTFFDGYTPLPGAYDEAQRAEGVARPNWSAFCDGFHQIGIDEFSRRWGQAQRLIRDNGLAYSAHADPDEKPRPWELDPLPLLIDQHEWATVSAALEQRARLLNLVLADLYGPQTILERGLCPAELVLGNPLFLRPCHGQKPVENSWLTFYAADLARAPDGGWWVLADRTEAPSGAGYALENRIVMSRMLPDLFRRCGVQRLAGYFIAVQKRLLQLAQSRTDNPHVVLLSQGSQHPNYFEDSYLARYLGYTLAESGDLGLRSGQVMLRTLSGLTPVDVILRRPNSGDSDPLNFPDGAALGAAGLLQACLGGSVAVANPLGSGLVESPVFMAFLPRLCVELLGEELKMPGVATWWCGDEVSRKYVLEHLGDLVIKRAFRDRGREFQMNVALNRMSKKELKERIQAQPQAYVAQEMVARSSIPTFSGNKIRPSRLALRAFVVGNEDGYEIMPGGLARVSSELESLELSVVSGELSKDVWIMGGAPINPPTLLPRNDQAIELRRHGADLPSRVADNILWLGRQMERADASARLLRATALRIGGEDIACGGSELPVLLRTLAAQGHIEPGFVLDGYRDSLPAIEKSLPAAVFDESLPSSLRSIVNEIVRLAGSARDRLSLDSWRIVRHIDEEFRPQRPGKLDLTDVLSATNRLVLDMSALAGMVMESMTRAQAFRFLDLGRRMERACQINGLIRHALVGPLEIDTLLLQAVLEISDSLMTYRARYLANINLAAVLDLVLTDESNPRSMAYQFVALEKLVDELPRDMATPGYGPEQKAAMNLLHTIRMVDVSNIAVLHHLGEHHHLEELLNHVDKQIPELTDAISRKYLIHSESSKFSTSPPH
ncbi:circularly permuted type 2 ATP-grasp protein [Lignipirellula cremea]|uniref:Uncharacterized protein n=1 Tax=Lignipirellula cremea TaxID=2528010 RepID=A0A518DMT6_9BACT|nr:circularly permuted type 2 ATP-grasp protein [Lignipirellula cremea]QDU93154.1 hypothetical protein Pla8534_09330 [Lignipirellula cremea]